MERDGKERGGKRVGRERRKRIAGRRQEVGQGGKRKGEKCEREERGGQEVEVERGHRWALSPISVISDIGLSLISEFPISD